MSNLDDALAKIPKPLLIFGALAISISVMLYSNPLKNGCDVQISNFTANVKGYLINSRNAKKKLKLAEVNTSKVFCKTGNSPGACENYFLALKKISEAFVTFDNKCLPQLKEDESFSNLESQLKDAVKILSLLAWGDQPPAGLAVRAGWLSKSELYTFCRLKTVLIDLIDEEEYLSFRISVYKEFPALWSDKLKELSQSENTDKLVRPLAFKSAENPTGVMSESMVLQRSLFSLRCEQYQ